MYFDRFNESGKLSQEFVYLARTKPVSKLLFRPFKYILVFQEKWRRS
jgi:hypothetical protein